MYSHLLRALVLGLVFAASSAYGQSLRVDNRSASEATGVIVFTIMAPTRVTTTLSGMWNITFDGHTAPDAASLADFNFDRNANPDTALPASRMWEITAGTTSTAVVIHLFNDDRHEQAERFNFVVTDNAATPNTVTAIGTINDDDPEPDLRGSIGVTLTHTDDGFAEDGGTAVFTVALDRSPLMEDANNPANPAIRVATTVKFTVAGDLGTRGGVTIDMVDVTPDSNGEYTLNIAAGETSNSITVTAGPDPDIVNEVITVTVTDAMPATGSSNTFRLPPAVTATIDDDDLTVSISGDANVAETADTITYRLTLSGTPTTTEAVTVNVAVGGDATATGPATAMIPAGLTTATFTVTLDETDTDTATDQGPETVTVTITIPPPPDGAGGGSNVDDITIVDADAATVTRATVTTNVIGVATSPRRTPRLKTTIGVLTRAGSHLAKDLIHGRLDGGEGPAQVVTIAGQPLRPVAGDTHDAAAGPWAASPVARADVVGSGGGGAGVGTEQLLNSAFTFNASPGDADYPLGVWGAGGSTDLRGHETLAIGSAASRFNYSGRVSAFHVGTDRWRGPDNLVGMSVSHTFGDMRVDDTEAGNTKSNTDVEMRLTGVHPYYSHWVTPNLYLWTAAGLSTGTAKVTETFGGRRSISSSLSSTMLGGGVNGRMQWSNAVDIGLRASLVYTRGELDGGIFDDGATPLLAASAATLRLDSEWEVGRHISTNRGALRPFFVAGFRQDYQDAKGDVVWNVGSGAEFSSHDGLVIRVQGKNQVSTSNANHRENSVSAEVRWAWNLGRFGFAPYTTLNVNDADGDWIGGVQMILPGTGLRLGFEAGVGDDGANYGNLFSGEWRF